MDVSDDGMQWDPYETSHRRDFVYRPNSSEIVYSSTARAHRNPYTLDKSLNSTTVYNEEFCWKPSSKPACIRTGTINNPHPNENFMVWRLPRGPNQMSAYEGKPGAIPFTEQQIADALSAQYRSTYSTDYLGIPQGVQKPNKLKPLESEKVVKYNRNTEMRQNYRQPPKKASLEGNTTRYGCNALHGVAPKGIVPTVVQSHIRNQENRREPTTYDLHFGGKNTDISGVLRSLQAQELKQLYKHLTQKDKDAVDAFLRVTTPGFQEKKRCSPTHSSSKKDWMSSWPGPL